MFLSDSSLYIAWNISNLKAEWKILSLQSSPDRTCRITVLLKDFQAFYFQVTQLDVKIPKTGKITLGKCVTLSVLDPSSVSAYSTDIPHIISRIFLSANHVLQRLMAKHSLLNGGIAAST